MVSTLARNHLRHTSTRRPTMRRFTNVIWPVMSRSNITGFSRDSKAVDTEEVQLAGLRMQAHPSPLPWRVVTAGERHDGLTDYLVRARDSAIQVGIRTEFFDHVDLHFDAAVAQFEMFGT